jgi:hypothetical protein
MRKYLLHFFLVVLPILFACLVFACWSEPLYGDLTRIGKWSEHDFGPNALHPTIHIKADGLPLINADVVVLGDSFSVRNLWQSALSDSTGYAIQSFQYQKNCTANWLDAVIARPSNKIVVLEVVEREFISKFGHLASCVRKEPIPAEVLEVTTASRRPTWPLTFSLSYLISTAVNTAQLNHSPQKQFDKDDVINAPLRAGCANFSSRRNDRLLYFSDDNLKQQWGEQKIHDAVANVLDIQKKVEASGKKFIFVMVPDKSTVYRDCLTSGDAAKEMPDINKSLISSGVHTPDLQTPLRNNVKVIVDLYDPDNTHWSEAGYIFASNEIGKYLFSENKAK